MLKKLNKENKKSISESISNFKKLPKSKKVYIQSKRFKNVRSTILLKEVIKQINSKGYFINNIDINIIAQTPKIKNLKKIMIDNIAKLCEISKDQINIKGKTTEKLGVIGKEKAIACEVICSVIKYD